MSDRTDSQSSLAKSSRYQVLRSLLSRAKWGLVALIALTVLLRSPDLPYHYADWDEAAMMAQAWAMTKGELLYQDIQQVHPILNFAIFYPFFYLLPPDSAPHYIKLLNLLLVILGSWLIYQISLRWLGDHSLSLIAGLSFVYYLGHRWALSSYGEFYAIFPTLVSFYFLFMFRAVLPITYVLVGGLWSVAFFLKQTAIFDISALFLCVLYFRCTDARDRLKKSAYLTSGSLIILSMILIYFLASGTLNEAVSSSFYGLVFRYAQLGSLGSGSVLDAMLERLSLLKDVVTNLATLFSLPMLAMIAGLLTAFFSFLGIRSLRSEISGHFQTNKQRVALFFVLVAWFLAGLVALIAIGRYTPHYTIQLLPSLILSSVFFLRGLKPTARVMICAAVIVVSLTLGTAVFVDRMAKTLRGPERVTRSQSVADYLEENLLEDDRIFLYRYQGLDVFYLAGKLSNNGIYMFIDMFAEHSKDPLRSQIKQKEFLENLPRALIVDPHGPLLGCHSAETFFGEVLHRHYRLRTVIDGVQIYFLDEVPAGVP